MSNESQRRFRCAAMGLDCKSLGEIIAHEGPLATVVSSRLGHDVKRHRIMARHLAASMQSFRDEGSTLLIARGTAIEPWVIQAADVFGVPMVVFEKSDDRDVRMIAMADRVDVVYSRPRGKIAKWVRQRCQLASGSVRLAVHHKADHDLLAAGAIGCFLPSEPAWPSHPTSPAIPSSYVGIDQIPWNEFLVHCTRAAPGPWPRQTMKQYRDDLLLGDGATAARDAAGALLRIVRQRRLIASAVASSHQFPVVCFFQVAKPTLLERRTYRSHLHRWDYEPYGIAIRKSAAIQMGLKRCLYGHTETRNDLPVKDRYRFQSLGRSSGRSPGNTPGKTSVGSVGWDEEREWRSSTDVDLDQIAPHDVCVFTSDQACQVMLNQVNHRGWTIVRV